MDTQAPGEGPVARLLTADEAAALIRPGQVGRGYDLAIRAAAKRWGFAGVGLGGSELTSGLLVCPWSALPVGHPLAAMRAPFGGVDRQGRTGSVHPTTGPLPVTSRSAALLVLRTAGPTEPKELARVVSRALRGHVSGIDAYGAWLRPAVRDLAPAVPVLLLMGFDKVPGVPGHYHLDLGQTVTWRPVPLRRAILAPAARRPAPVTRNSAE